MNFWYQKLKEEWQGRRDHDLNHAIADSQKMIILYIYSDSIFEIKNKNAFQ